MMFFREKSRDCVSTERALSLEEILGCDGGESAECRLQGATILDLFLAQTRAVAEERKGNAAAIGALSLLCDEAGNRDVEHRYLLEVILSMHRKSLAGLFDAYGRSKDLPGEDRLKELIALAVDCRNSISGIMIVNRAVQQDLRLEREKGYDDC
jgi:hypothetical protein